MPTKYTPGEQSTHLCECGCGQPTKPAPYSNKRKGWVKGQPLRFIDKHGSGRPIAERFWKKVDKSGDCWMWTGYKNTKGYGYIGIGSKTQRAHRVAWELEKGPIPEGIEVCHRCDNPSCVRVSHLFLGAPVDNTADMWSKGRGAARLTEAQVIEIRQRYAQGNVTYIMLASDYGVHWSTIAYAVTRKTWKHIP